MKWQLGTVGLLALALSACGNAGNPNGMAYAGQDGGTIAVKPQTIGTVTYQPYAKAASFQDMKPVIATPGPYAAPAR